MNKSHINKDAYFRNHIIPIGKLSINYKMNITYNFNYNTSPLP